MSVYHPASTGSFGIQPLRVGRAVATRIATLLAAPFAAIARQARIERTAQQLRELDERTLADIGLRRTQILSTAAQVVDWPDVDPRRPAR